MHPSDKQPRITWILDVDDSYYNGDRRINRSLPSISLLKSILCSLRIASCSYHSLLYTNKIARAQWIRPREENIISQKFKNNFIKLVVCTLLSYVFLPWNVDNIWWVDIFLCNNEQSYRCSRSNYFSYNILDINDNCQIRAYIYFWKKHKKVKYLDNWKYFFRNSISFDSVLRKCINGLLFKWSYVRDKYVFYLSIDFDFSNRGGPYYLGHSNK